LVCPYCLSPFTVAKALESDGDRVRWGLARCGCFTFPIVDGVLLLSLAKGYGGSEEALQPYTPLQVAALEFLHADDLPALRAWIDRHVPLLARLIRPEPLAYLDFMRDLNGRLYREVERDLHAWGRWEVLGRRASYRRQPSARKAFAATWAGATWLGLRARWAPAVFESFYVARFVTPQLEELRLRLRPLPFDGPLLSIACGHGPFELLVQARQPAADIVSVDGQLLNLFVTRRFVNPEGDYICHDVQFPLPFADGAFAGVFSSSCLIEIPTQASFVREAVRVTSASGWTIFDAIGPEPDTRVTPTRFYRVCQNSLGSLAEYLRLLGECANGRPLHMTTSTGVGPWHRDAGLLTGLRMASFAVTSLAIDATVQATTLTPGERARLHVNPKFDVRDEKGRLIGRLRPEQLRQRRRHPDLVSTLPEEITIEKARLSDAEFVAGLCRTGVLALLPDRFGTDIVSAFGATSRESSPGG
jgi:SAM-dependent methyltransferase